MNKGFELFLLLPKVDVEGVAPSLTISQVSTKLNALNYFTPQKLNKIKVLCRLPPQEDGQYGSEFYNLTL